MFSRCSQDDCRIFSGWSFDLRRGVRSGVQLSCTETRFQKCSESGKMVLNTQCYQYLLLTMWFHTKKIKRSAQKRRSWFYHINSAPDLRNDQKSPKKNRSLNRDLLNFVYRYGIFQMPPGESSCPGSSEYVWQRGPKICAKHVLVVRELFKIFLLF